MNDNRPICPHCIAEITYDDMTDALKADFKKAYEEAKAYRQELINEKDSEYTAIRELVKEEIKGLFQEAAKLFEE